MGATVHRPGDAYAGDQHVDNSSRTCGPNAADYQVGRTCDAAKAPKSNELPGFPTLDLVSAPDGSQGEIAKARQEGTNWVHTYADDIQIVTNDQNRTLSISDGHGVTFTPDAKDPNLWHSTDGREWHGWPVVDATGRLPYQPAEGSASTPFQAPAKGVLDQLEEWWKSL